MVQIREEFFRLLRRHHGSRRSAVNGVSASLTRQGPTVCTRPVSFQVLTRLQSKVLPVTGCLQDSTVGIHYVLPGPVSATVVLHRTNTAQQFSGRRCSFILYATWDTRLLTSGPSRPVSPLRLLIRWYRVSTQPALRQQGQSLARQQFASRLYQTLLRVLGISLDLGHPVVDVFNQQCLFIHFIYSASGWQFGAMFHGVETALCGYAL